MSSSTGIRLELTTRLSKNARAQIVDLLARLGLPRESWPMRLQTRVTIADGYRRVDFEGNGPLGKNVTMISGPKGGFWIQHDAKVFVEVEHPNQPKPPGPKVRAKKTGAARQSTTQRSRPVDPCVTVTDADSGRSVRITAMPNPEWRAPALASQLVSVLMGGPRGELPAGFDEQHWTRLFAQEGLPSEMRFEAVDERGEPTELLSTVAITKFVSDVLEPNAFAVPSGYRKWRLRDRGRAKKDQADRGATAEPGYSVIPARPVSGSSNDDVGVSRQALDDEPREPRDDFEPPPRPPRATFTTQPRIGFRLEQRVLDHIAMLFNAAITPIRTVTIGQGRFLFDWLDQLRNDVLRRGAGAAGTAVFQLLHDVSLPAMPVTPRPAPASDFASFMCRGLLDQIAIRDAERLIRAGVYPQTTIMTFAPSMRNLIAAAGTNWDLLPDGVKARLTFELVRRKYGVVSFTFPTGSPPGGALGLMNFQASNILGGLTLPPAPPPAVTDDPPLNPLLSLTAGFGGAIDGTLSLGSIALAAQIARWPTANFFLLLAGAGIVLLFFPTLAWALGLVSGLALLLSMDVVNASLTATGLSASLSIRFVQDSQKLFVPVTSCTIGGTLRFGWVSTVPTGIHQILAAIEEGIVNTVIPAVMTALSNGIATTVNDAVMVALGRGFPASALRLGLPISGGTRGGRTARYTYLEAQLDPSKDPRFAVTPVATPTGLETAQDADAARATPTLGADHYGSLSFDQNFLNITLAGMRLAGWFDGAWPPQATAPIKPLMPPPIPRNSIADMRLAVESGPSMLLASSAAGNLTSHGNVQFFYVLTLRKNTGLPAAVIRFRVDTFGDLVLGSALDPAQVFELIQIQTLRDRAFDLLLHQPGAVLTPTAFEIITVTEVRTESIDYDSRGKPHRTVEVDYVETNSPVPLTAPTVQSLDPLLRRVLADAWWYRGRFRAPRGDGVAPGMSGLPPDPVTRFRYPLGSQDPDTLDTEVHVRVELGLERGLAHFHIGHAGLATTPLLPIRTGSLIPFLATLSSSSSVPGILASVAVKASTLSDRDLSL